MPVKKPKKRVQRRKPAPAKKKDVLDVEGMAALLTVSTDTVYELLKSGELPGRKVGRKWITTRSAVMRWLEQRAAAPKPRRGIEGDDKDAIIKALQSGSVRVRAA